MSQYAPDVLCFYAELCYWPSQISRMNQDITHYIKRIGHIPDKHNKINTDMNM